MVRLKTPEQIEILHEGGRRLATILLALKEAVRPGIATKELDVLAEKLILEGGDEPSFKGYKPKGASRPFPAALCTAVNDEVVHGIPSLRVLKEGDIIGLDLGLTHKGLITDAAITVQVGKVARESQELITTTEEALAVGIRTALVGANVGDIGAAIEEYVRPFGYGIVRELSGHGVGFVVHEEPHIPNFGKRGAGARLTAGMVLALEPMITLGKHAVYGAKDGYTVITRDGSRSAHFKHSIAISKYGPLVLTCL